ncbi:hypothetical protein [Mycobacterium intracellulare]|nr:hypothetical protein [Mycobacterium intracellulare]MEE3755265.1 hypothetical protein [Mycobacterium intracellulare]
MGSARPRLWAMQLGQVLGDLVDLVVGGHDSAVGATVINDDDARDEIPFG